eukprot:gene11321-12334_t
MLISLHSFQFIHLSLQKNGVWFLKVICEENQFSSDWIKAASDTLIEWPNNWKFEISTSQRTSLEFRLEVQLKGFISPKAIYRGTIKVENGHLLANPMSQQPVIQDVLLQMFDMKSSVKDPSLMIPATMKFSIEPLQTTTSLSSTQERRRSLMQTMIEKGHFVHDNDSLDENSEDDSSLSSTASLENIRKVSQKETRDGTGTSASKPPRKSDPAVNTSKKASAVQEFVEAGLIDEDDSHQGSFEESDLESIGVKLSTTSQTSSQLPTSNNRAEKLKTFLRKGSIDEDNSEIEDNSNESDDDSNNSSTPAIPIPAVSGSTVSFEEDVHVFNERLDLPNALKGDDDSLLDDDDAINLSYSRSSVNSSFEQGVKHLESISAEDSSGLMSKTKFVTPDSKMAYDNHDIDDENVDFRERMAQNQEDSDVVLNQKKTAWGENQPNQLKSSVKEQNESKQDVPDNTLPVQQEASNPFLLAAEESDEEAFEDRREESKHDVPVNTLPVQQEASNPFLLAAEESDEEQEASNPFLLAAEESDEEAFEDRREEVNFNHVPDPLPVLSPIRPRRPMISASSTVASTAGTEVKSSREEELLRQIELLSQSVNQLKQENHNLQQSTVSQQIKPVFDGGTRDSSDVDTDLKRSLSVSLSESGFSSNDNEAIHESTSSYQDSLMKQLSDVENINQNLQNGFSETNRRNASKAMIEACLTNMIVRKSLNIPMPAKTSLLRQEDESRNNTDSDSMDDLKLMKPNSMASSANPIVTRPTRLIERRRGVFDPNTMTLSDLPSNSILSPLSTRTTTPVPSSYNQNNRQVGSINDDAYSISFENRSTNPSPIPTQSPFISTQTDRLNFPKQKRLTAEDRKKSRLSLMSTGPKGSILSPSPTPYEEKKISEAVNQFTTPLKRTLSHLILGKDLASIQNISSAALEEEKAEKERLERQKQEEEEKRRQEIENLRTNLLPLPSFITENKLLVFPPEDKANSKLMNLNTSKLVKDYLLLEQRLYNTPESFYDNFPVVKEFVLVAKAEIVASNEKVNSVVIATTTDKIDVTSAKTSVSSMHLHPSMKPNISEGDKAVSRTASVSQPTTKDMKEYYSELFEILLEAIRPGILRCFRIMELSIATNPSPSGGSSNYNHPNNSSLQQQDRWESSSTVGNRRRSVSAAGITMNNRPFANSHDALPQKTGSVVIPRKASTAGTNDFDNMSHHRGTSTPSIVPLTNYSFDFSHNNRSRRNSLVPLADNYDLPTLFLMILQSNNPDEQLRTKIQITLSQMLRIDNLEQFLKHVQNLAETYQQLQQNSINFIVGEYWDLSGLFNSARILISTFCNDESHSSSQTTSMSGRSSHVSGMPPTHTTSHATQVHLHHSKLKHLQESLKQQLLLYREHLFWSTKIGMGANATLQSDNPHIDSQDENEAEMKHFYDRLTDESFYALQTLAGLNKTNNSRHSLSKSSGISRNSSLLQSCEALLAQFMIFSLPRNIALLELMMRLTVLQECLTKQRHYFKSLGNREMGKYCKRLSAAIDQQLKMEKELLDHHHLKQASQQLGEQQDEPGSDASLTNRLTTLVGELDDVIQQQFQSFHDEEQESKTERESTATNGERGRAISFSEEAKRRTSSPPQRRVSSVFYSAASNPATSSALLCTGKYCLEKIRSIITKSEEIYHRYVMHKESLQAMETSAAFNHLMIDSSTSEEESDGTGLNSDDSDLELFHLSDSDEGLTGNAAGKGEAERRGSKERRSITSINSLSLPSTQIKKNLTISTSDPLKADKRRKSKDENHITVNLSSSYQNKQKLKQGEGDLVGEGSNVKKKRKEKSKKSASDLKKEEKRLDQIANELFNYKEEMKKRIASLAAIINIDETERFIKSVPNPDQLSNQCYMLSYAKRDEDTGNLVSQMYPSSNSGNGSSSNSINIAVLLLRIQSKHLLSSVYCSWPGLSFEVPSSDLNPIELSLKTMSGAAGEANHPMLRSQSKSFHKTVSYHEDAFPSHMQSPPRYPLSPTFQSANTGSAASHMSIHSSLNSHNHASQARSPPFNISSNNTAVASVHTAVGRSSHHSDSSTSMMKHLDFLTSQQEAMLFTYAKDIDLQEVDFLNTKSLRKVGFALTQLRDSRVYSWNQLLSAGYPLTEIKYLRGTSSDAHSLNSLTRAGSGSSSGIGGKNHHHDHSFELTVPELRKAGYSIEQCVKAGFDITAIKAGGFDELQLVQCGLFTSRQLLRAGCDIQRYVLRNFYDSLDGRHWRHHENWCTTKPLSEWYGVKVDSFGNVIAIDLRSNELYGSLPEALYLMTSLQSLDLSNNSLEGEFPTSYQQLQDLKDLWLDRNPAFARQVTKAQIQQLLPSCRIRI